MAQLLSVDSLFPLAEVDALLADIKSADPAVRKAALVAVRPVLADGVFSSIVYAIGNALAATDAETRELAAIALAAAGWSARGELLRLVGALVDSEPPVRRAVALAVAQVGAGDASSSTALVGGLNDSDAGVREQCAAGLADQVCAEEGKHPGVVPDNWEAAGAALAAAARDPVLAVRRAAVRALVAFAECGKPSHGMEEAAARALSDRDAAMRTEGLRLMTAANMQTVESLPRLTALLADPDAGLRRLSARTLARLGSDAAPAASALRAALDDDDRLVARAAMEALALVAFDQRPWTPYLLQIREFAGPARPELREGATRLLDAPVEVVAPWLGELVDDSDEGIRWNAGLGLWRCGTSAGVAAAALSRMLTDHSSALRVAAVVGLLGAGPAAGAEGVRALALRLTDDELWVRQLAAVALGAMGPLAKAALPALTSATADDREKVRTAAAEAIRRITTR